MEFVLVNKFFKVGKTAVSIQCDKPFTFFTRELRVIAWVTQTKHSLKQLKMCYVQN